MFGIPILGHAISPFVTITLYSRQKLFKRSQQHLIWSRRHHKTSLLYVRVTNDPRQ